MFVGGFLKVAAMHMSMPKPPRMNAGAGTAHLHRTAPSPVRSTKPGGVVQSRPQNMTSQLGGVTATNG